MFIDALTSFYLLQVDPTPLVTTFFHPLNAFLNTISPLKHLPTRSLHPASTHPYIRLSGDGSAQVQVHHLGGAVGQCGVALHLLLHPCDPVRGPTQNTGRCRAKVAQDVAAVTADQNVLHLWGEEGEVRLG